MGIVFVILSNFFSVYTAPLVRYAVDFIKQAVEAPENYTSEVISKKLIYYGLLIIGAALLNGLFMFFMRQTIIVMSRHIEFDLKNEVYAHYQKLDLAFYKRNNTGDLMNRISEDVSRVRMYIGPAIMYVVNTLGTFVLTLVFMFNVNTTLTWYVLLPLPVLTIAIYYVSAAINKKSTHVQEQLSELSTLSQESFSGIRVIKAYGKENYYAEKFEKESEVYKDKNLSLVKTEALFQPFMILLIGISTITTIYIGGMQVIKGSISMGNIAEFIIYVNKLTWPVASLGWVSSLIQRAAASQTRINEFLQTEPEIKNENTATENIRGAIQFKNVDFVYPDSGIRALKNISFNVEPGKTLAIVGKTGSGKSTIANLICRLHDATKGEIVVDEKNIKQQNLYNWRSSIGYVPQEVFLFSDTIANNIAFSTNRDSEGFSADQIENAAKDAVIYNDIEGFPEKFDTVVGERGITLSGGQKQRTSIARAIIKNPQVLIFDDCLSAVDTETEEKILTNLKRIMRGKTSIIISHRASSVKDADHIIVLSNGELIEEGNHTQLFSKKGYYYEMYQSQLMEN